MVINNSSQRESDVIREIIRAEKSRAKVLIANPSFQSRVQAIREKYIVNGFLMPLYEPDGRYSRFKTRVRRFGNYLVSWEMAGKEFDIGKLGWIRNESIWFNDYLVNGQKTMTSNSTFPETFKIEGIPANLIWEEIIALLKEVNLIGMQGGGVLIDPYDLNETVLSCPVGPYMGTKGEINYMGSNLTPEFPGWMMRFKDYDSWDLSPENIEFRPAWFILAKHIFYNTPLRLPVFSAVFATRGQMEKMEFLEDNLSDQARGLIGKALLNMPIKLKAHAKTIILQRGRPAIIWWLWRNIKNVERNRILTYGEIVHITGQPKSSIEMAVKRLNKKLTQKLTGKLLGQLLSTARARGLNLNLVYNTLVEKKLVPPRKRDIDDLDDLEKLI